MHWFCDCQAFPVFIVLNQSPPQKVAPLRNYSSYPKYLFLLIIVTFLQQNELMNKSRISRQWKGNRGNLSCKPNQRRITVQKMAPENSGSRSRKGFFLRTKTKESSHVNASYVGLFLVLTQSFFHVSVVLARPTFRNNSHWFLLFLLKTQLLLSQKYLFVPCLPHSLYSWKPAIDPLRGQTFFILPLSFTFSL